LPVFEEPGDDFIVALELRYQARYLAIARAERVVSDVVGRERIGLHGFTWRRELLLANIR
jgi:hypothetical protein